MRKENLSSLVSQLSERDKGMSKEQKQLLESVERHIHNWDQPDPIDPSMKDTLEVLLVDIENEHPKASAIIEKTLEMLSNIGI